MTRRARRSRSQWDAEQGQLLLRHIPRDKRECPTPVKRRYSEADATAATVNRPDLRAYECVCWKWHIDRHRL